MMTGDEKKSIYLAQEEETTRSTTPPSSCQEINEVIRLKIWPTCAGNLNSPALW